MVNAADFSVDPMAAFYAAVTAVENGSVGEIEIAFDFSNEQCSVTMSISVRREIRPMVALTARVVDEEN